MGRLYEWVFHFWLGSKQRPINKSSIIFFLFYGWKNIENILSSRCERRIGNIGWRNAVNVLSSKAKDDMNEYFFFDLIKSKDLSINYQWFFYLFFLYLLLKEMEWNEEQNDGVYLWKNPFLDFLRNSLKHS